MPLPWETDLHGFFRDARPASVAFCALIAPLALAASSLLCAAPTMAAGGGKSFFFATRDACYASAIFRKWECDNAFANASAQVRARAPTFAAKFECQLHFQLCQRRVDAAPETEAELEAESDSLRYGPEMLGVEIFEGPAGIVTSPVLAVASPPGMFEAQPIARLVESAEEPEKPKGAILPADRFLPLSTVKVDRGWSPFSQAPASAAAPTAQRDAEKDDPADEKSLTQRRERLRSAPFVE